MERTVFSFLHILLLVTMFLGGNMLSKSSSSRDFWHKALIPILMYGVVVGLRFGRMVDWNLYYFRFLEIGKNFEKSNYEILFKIFNYIFYSIGLPYWFFIFCESLLLMFSLLFLFQYFKKELFFILPLCLDLIHNNELYIRWYFAVCFFVVAISFIIYSMPKKAYIFMLIACLVHYGMVPLIPIVLFAKYLNKYAISPKVACILFLVTTLGMKVSQLSFFTEISNYILGLGLVTNDSAEFYLSRTEDLINGDLGNIGIRDSMSYITQMRLFIAYIPIILFSEKSCAKRKYGKLIYNIFVVGAIVSPLFNSIEITDRYSSLFLLFGCLCGGFLFYDKFIKRDFSNNSLIQLKMLFYSICFLSYLWPSISICFMNLHINEVLYIWDANGRNYLPF